MCFMLYAGTARPIPRREWKEGALDLPVRSLTEGEAPIRAHFRSAEVQFVGSTSGCGCDFPCLQWMQNGEWAPLEFSAPDEQVESEATARRNMKALVDLLRETGEKAVEFYLIYRAGEDAFSEPPASLEDLPLESFLNPDFHFKEWGFYWVSLQTQAEGSLVPEQE